VTEKACKQCHRIVEGDVCPVCKESQLTPSWKGFVVVIDPATSEIAKHLKITTPGKYALRLGKT
jgi:DNA-directed RNA polymerase subunit E"